MLASNSNEVVGKKEERIESNSDELCANGLNRAPSILCASRMQDRKDEGRHTMPALNGRKQIVRVDEMTLGQHEG